MKSLLARLAVGVALPETAQTAIVPMQRDRRAVAKNLADALLATLLGVRVVRVGFLFEAT